MEQRPANQEIDLLKLLAKTYNIIKKNIILVIVCPGLGLLLGFLYVQFSTQPKLSNNVSEASLMIATDLLAENEANFLCNYLTSSDSLPGFNKEQKESVVSLSYEVKKEQVRDRILVFIKLSATVTQHSVLSALQNALVTYFSQSEPVIRQRSLKEKLYKSMITKLDEEIAGLEEMKLTKKEKVATILSNPYSQSADLYERKLNYQHALASSHVYVVKGFGPAVPVKVSASPKLPYIILGFLSGIVILIIILFLRFFRNYYKQFEQENN
jgi:hypothetical protein